MPIRPLVRPSGIWENINKRHPLSRQLGFYILPRLNYVRNIVDGQSVSSLFTTLNNTPFGPGALINSDATAPTFATGYTPITTSSGDGLGDYTVACIANPTSVATAAFLLSNRKQGSTIGLPQWNLVANYSYLDVTAAGKFCLMSYFNGVYQGAETAATAVDGTYHVVVATRLSNVCKIYVDGIDKTAASGGSGILITEPGQAFRLGENAGQNVNLYANCTNVLWAGWNRGFGPQEVAAFTSDPWFPLRRPSATRQRTFASIRQSVVPFFRTRTYLRR